MYVSAVVQNIFKIQIYRKLRSADQTKKDKSLRTIGQFTSLSVLTLFLLYSDFHDVLSLFILYQMTTFIEFNES